MRYSQSPALGALFAIAVGSAWWRGLDISCGCFGALVSGHVDAWHILSALLLLGAGIALLVYNGRLKENATARDDKHP